MLTVQYRGLLLTVSIVIAVFFFFEKCSYAATTDDHGNSIFQVGEELTYNVSYAFIDIGQVRVKIIDKIQQEGSTSYKAFCYVDSYKNLPFVDLHTTYESIISESLYSYWFRGRDKEKDYSRTSVYHFDYGNGRVYIEQTIEPGDSILKRDTLAINSHNQDGLSLFFHARYHVRSSRTMNVPVVVNEKKGSTLLHFTNEHTEEKIDAVDYPIDVVYFDGKADFVGVFGLTGEFEGWFSNDEARVPILAKMKVLIGNIRIELMKWKRDGWNPPQYVKDKGK